jgi:hypothetical protein
MEDRKAHWLPVDDPRHSSVLGYHASTTGKELWKKIDLANWWSDGTADWTYLHVPCRKDTEEGRDGCVYRVRCWHSVGEKYRGREVYDVGLGLRDGRLHWIIRTKGKELTGKEPTHAAEEG